MALTPEIEAQILRYYHAERWRIGTIASQLHIAPRIIWCRRCRPVGNC